MRSSFWPNIIFLFFVVFCIYSLIAWHPHTSDDHSKINRENAFFSVLHFQQFDEQGELKNQFQASKLSLLSNKEALFTKPTFLMMTNDHTPWTATSDQGNAYNNGEKVELTGSVHLTQLPSSQSPKTDITTPSLWIFPKKSYATTNALIHVNRPGMNISGKGMEADLKNNHFTLQSETVGYYKPNENEEGFHFQSQSMKYNGKNHSATYFHNVRIAKSNQKIQGDRVIIHTDANNQIKDLQALGNPARYQSTAKDTPTPLKARAQSIHFDAKQNIAILKRHAKVTQGKDELDGDYVWYDIKQGIAKTHSSVSRHKTVILLGPDKETK